MKEKLAYTTKLGLIIMVAICLILGGVGIFLRIVREHPLRHVSEEGALFVARFDNTAAMWNPLYAGITRVAGGDILETSSALFPVSMEALYTLAVGMRVPSYMVRYADGFVGIFAPRDEQASLHLAETFTGWVMEPCGSLVCMAEHSEILQRHMLPRSGEQPLASIVTDTDMMGGPIGFQSVHGLDWVAQALLAHDVSYANFAMSVLTSTFDAVDGMVLPLPDGATLALQMRTKQPMFREFTTKDVFSDQLLMALPQEATHVMLTLIPEIPYSELRVLLGEMFGPNIAHALLVFAEGRIGDLMPLSLAHKLFPLMVGAELMYAYLPEHEDAGDTYVLVLRGNTNNYAEIQHILKEVMAFRFGLQRESVRLPDQSRGTLLRLGDAEISEAEIGTGYLLTEVSAGQQSLYMSAYDDMLIVATEPHGVDAVRSADGTHVSETFLEKIRPQQLLDWRRSTGEHPVEQMLGVRIFADRIRFDLSLISNATPE